MPQTIAAADHRYTTLATGSCFPSVQQHRPGCQTDLFSRFTARDFIVLWLQDEIWFKEASDQDTKTYLFMMSYWIFFSEIIRTERTVILPYDNTSVVSRLFTWALLVWLGLRPGHC